MKRKALVLTTRSETSELEELLFALGADLVASVLQKRGAPDPVTFLGTGKLQEARETQRALGADLVVVNAALKPGQIYSLQRFFSDGAQEDSPVEVYDRTRLILEIFRERAQSPEARLQVELAQLTYDMPLVKEAINREKKGERQAAMFGGGEYGVNEYYDMMKRRMARLRRDLDKIRLERGVRRKHRRRGGFQLVSLAGYTNAGKSSLLRALSARDTLVEDRYFSTLSTKTARATSDRREILVTDTVGFIEDLPPWMVEAFHSTLEEIALADVILLVVDASDPVQEMARRLRSSLRILHEFEAEGGGAAARMPYRRALAPILVALNKTDRVAGDELDAKQRALEGEGLLSPASTVRVSAHTRVGIDALYEKLYDLIPDYDEYEVALPASPQSESLIAWLHEHTDVVDLTRGQEVHLHFEAKRSLRPTLVTR
ncbi:MAG TPA: GTPase HflX, partial [Candidatus Thermoplasmatota archaeon]|nr:GTPase HflX [Candidatus Thermoplasmatota archaeon]